MLIDASNRAGFVAGLSADGPAFVYSGMGAQWWGMGGELYEAEPVFRAAVDRCDALWPGPSLLRGLRGDGSAMSDPADAQPAGLALQVGLTELWRSRGVSPGAVVGHSFGELAAAWAAGALTLEQAVEVAWHRSRLEQTLVGSGGGMLASRDVLTPPAGVTVAAFNGPSSVTLAGDVTALASVEGKRLNVSIAYHTAAADRFRDAFAAAVRHVRARAPRLPLYSTVEGGDVTAAGHWWRNLREPTHFDAALRRMARDGWTTFLELGPHPALAALVLETVPGATVAASMRRGRPQAAAFDAAFARVTPS